MGYLLRNMIAALMCCAAFTGCGDSPAPKIEAQVQVRRDIAFGPSLSLDIFEPEKSEASKRPAVILLFGGGWRQGSKAEMKDIAEMLAQQGFVAVTPDYRLARETANKYPAQLDDVQRAVRWIRANAEQYGIDPERIGAFGISSGAHLAALLGTVETRDNSDEALARYSSRVKCVVDTCGPMSFLDDVPVSEAAKGHVLNFLGKSAAEARGLYVEASPISYISAKTCPFLIFHGTADELVPISQSELMDKKLRAAGVESTLIKMEGEGHNFRGAENTQRWMQETAAFFKRHL
jgi:acetyl esterase/lipase